MVSHSFGSVGGVGDEALPPEVALNQVAPFPRASVLDESGGGRDHRDGDNDADEAKFTSAAHVGRDCDVDEEDNPASAAGDRRHRDDDNKTTMKTRPPPPPMLAGMVMMAMKTRPPPPPMRSGTVTTTTKTWLPLPQQRQERRIRRQRHGR